MRLTLIIRLLIYAFALATIFIGMRVLLTDSTTSDWFVPTFLLLMGAISVLSEVHRRLLKREADQA
ncbi:MAG: hypothetical protein GY926_16945 [bacterium]|nr:hypothetical protein [bacterium]